MESSLFLQSNVHRSLLYSNKPSSPFHSKPLFPRNAEKQRMLKINMAFMPQERSNFSNLYRTKRIPLMGIEGIPFPRMSSIKASVSKAGYIMQTSQLNLSLLNGLGIFGAVVLGALYALALKEKAESEATLESMRIKVKEKDTVILSMEKRFEMELLNEKGIRSKQLKDANDEKQSLIDQLTSANGTITKLGQELQQKGRSIDGLRAQIYSLEINLKNVENNKLELQAKLKEKLDSLDVLQGSINSLESEINSKENNIERLGTDLAEQERSLGSLTLAYQQSQGQVRSLESGMEKINDELQKYKVEMELKNDAVVNLNQQVTSLVAEREEMGEELDAIHSQYNNLKHLSAEKEASDVKMLEERQEKLNMLEKQLAITLDEDSLNKRLVEELTRERENLEKLLCNETEKVKILEEELLKKDVSSNKLKEEASDMDKQLQELRGLFSEREDELSKMKAEFNEERESLQRNLVEARQNEDKLISELASARNILNVKDEELKMRSHELASIAENRDSLQKELADAYDKAEAVLNALKEEKDTTSSLNSELEELESQVLKDQEERKSLEEDLDEATRSLVEMNQNSMSLSRNLELASSRILILEDDKNVLQSNLVEQTQISREAREKWEDAHDIVMRLKNERESLKTKAQTLEEELASAKGEMLHLSHQINSLRIPVNNQHQQNVESDDEKTAVHVKKTTTRRRKVSPPREHS